MSKERSEKKTIGAGAFWLAALAVLILIAAFWLMRSGKFTSNPQVATTPKKEVTKLTPIKNPKPSPVKKVVFSGGVFTPANLTIKVDTTVTFISADSNQFHLSSDLPGFDSAVDVRDYAFTFSQAGTFSYHNADNPPQAGQVTVTP